MVTVDEKTRYCDSPGHSPRVPATHYSMDMHDRQVDLCDDCFQQLQLLTHLGVAHLHTADWCNHCKSIVNMQLDTYDEMRRVMEHHENDAILLCINCIEKLDLKGYGFRQFRYRDGPIYLHAILLEPYNDAIKKFKETEKKE